MMDWGGTGIARMQRKGEQTGSHNAAIGPDILNGCPMGAVVTGPDGAHIRYANAAAAELLGHPRHHLAGTATASLPLGQRQQDRLTRLLSSGHGHLRSVALHPQGSAPRWIDISLQRLTFEGKAALLWWLSDVTARHQDAHALSVSKRAAEQSSRAKSDFLATMGHEIRTPVTGLVSKIRSLLLSRLDPAQRELAEAMRYDCEAVLSLLSDMLDVTRLDSGAITLTPALFDVYRLVDSSLSLVLSRAQEKGLRCTAHLPPDIPRRLYGDVERLRQLLWNLLSNAVKYTDQGSVTLRVDHRIEPAQDGQPPRHWLRFTVSDTGTGVADAVQRHLFKGIAGTRKTHHDTGLGLVICKKIVDLWGGAIGLDSIPGQGSDFWADLPFLPESEPEQRCLTLLLAEDNPVNQKIVVGLLEHHGHHVTLAVNGQEALDLLPSQPFDAVLMDMQMPVMDGLTATRRIRALPVPLGRIPIIALTANSMDGDGERCLAAGMNDHVGKPIIPDLLFAALNRQTRPLTPCAALPPPVAPLETNRLEELESLIGRSAMIELVTLFVSDARDRCRRLLSLKDSADLETMRDLAHDLKSTAGTFGFSSLSRLAEAIEISCRERRADEAQALLDHLQARWIDALASVHALVPELDDAPNPG